MDNLHMNFFLAQNVHFQQSKFRPPKFKQPSVKKPQICVLLQDALFYCMLYTIAQVAVTLLSHVRKLDCERESLFAISVTTNTITISHNGRLPERKTPSQLATYDNYNQ